MSEKFMYLDSQERKEIFETLATTMGRQAAVLEKDVWVCWALEAMFSLPNRLPMAFKGGTSLSKVFCAINRFSEDIDITIDYRALAERIDDEFDPFAENQSNNQIKRYGERLKKELQHYTNDQIVPFLQTQVELLPYAKNIVIEQADDGEKIWIHFPSAVEAQDDYLKSSILIELGGRNAISPNDNHSITPDIARELSDQNIIFPVAKVDVLAPERTFWEKATLIHAECNRGTLRSDPERLSRHWYDLHLLYKDDIGQSALQNRDLLHDVIKYKKCFFRSGYANYDACIAKQFKLIPNKEVLAELNKDYNNMRNMIYGATPTMDEIVASLFQLQTELNA